MILGAIISSHSEKILVHVVKFTTSQDVWQALECMFTSQSRARTMQIHYQLATLKKGNSSIVDYFHQFTTLVDTLAATAQPLNDFELVSFLLAGLGLDYDSFVTPVTTRVDPLSIEELYGHLLAHERLGKHVLFGSKIHEQLIKNHSAKLVQKIKKAILLVSLTLKLVGPIVVVYKLCVYGAIASFLGSIATS